MPKARPILTLALLSVIALPQPGLAQSGSSQGAATAAMLKDLIRIDTSNAPGDTREVADYLKRRFDAAGIPNEIILAPNGKAAHFIARLKGDGSKRPLLIAAHTDVVPAEKARWSVDPFGGIEKDGFIYGRGALDNKGAVAAFATAVLRLKAQGTKLSRDIIFLAEADEEQGVYNTNWLAQNHWPKLDAEFSLNEGERPMWDGRTVTQFNVSYADKLTLNLKLTATGETGHSSRPLPLDQTANGQLIAALDRLMRYETAIELNAPARAYFEAVAETTPSLRPPVAKLLAAADQPALKAAARDLVASDPRARDAQGLLRNTLVVTMIDSGIKPNVIPGTAEAVINARLLPGTTVDAFIAELRAVIGNDRIAIEPSRPGKSTSEVIAYYRERSSMAPSSLDTPLFAAIEKAVAQTWPKARVLPTIIVGATDATPWRQRGIPVYGIAPFPVTPEQTGGMHGDDERIAVQAVIEGSAFVARLLTEAAR